MSIQPYQGPGGTGASAGAIVPVGSAHELSEEEYAKRLEDAAKLEEKLKFITEKIPTRIMNTAGSNAGAGSGEFHMYRMARRREQMRLARIEEEAKAKELDEALEEKKERLRIEEEARTEKRRAKRQKKKAKKKRKVGETEGGGGPDGGAEAENTGEESDEEEPGDLGLD